MRKKMQDGKYSVVYSHFLGYDRGPDGGMVMIFIHPSIKPGFS